MDLTRRAPQLGIVVCLAVLAAIVAPYLLLPEDASTGISVYYESGFFGPTIVGLFAVVTVVIFGAALGGRTDPGTIAGATLVIGLFMALMSLEWALAVPVDVIQGISTQEWLDYHRWIVLALSGGVVVTSAIYARALGAV